MDEPNAVDASASLQAAKAAASAASAKGTMPWWLLACAGVSFAGGFVGFALLVEYPDTRLYLILALACLVLFLAFTVAASRVGGIVPRPAGKVGARLKWQALMVVPFALGGLAAIPFGFTGYLAVFGVSGGVALWAQMALAHRRGNS